MLKKISFLMLLLALFSGCAGFVQNHRKSYTVREEKPLEARSIDDNLILVSSGDYEDAKGVRHAVRSFYLSPYEVTQSEWKALMKVNPAEFKGMDPFPPFPGENQDNRPVEMISWFDALEFCNAKSIEKGLRPVYIIEGELKSRKAVKDPLANGYRLPSVREWEYAALSAGKERHIYSGTSKTGETLGLNAYAWFMENAEYATHEVGLKLSNSLGFYDMSGNVFEWCEDEGRLGPSSRIWKGGGAISEPEECLIFYSGCFWPETRNSFTGLRLARNAP